MFAKSIFILFIVTNIFSNSNTVYSQNSLITLHESALKTYRYDPISFKKSITSLDSLNKTIKSNRHFFIEKIITSLNYLNQGKLDNSLHICYNQFYNYSSLNFEDSIILNQQIGMIYLNLGEYKNSKSHFKKAINIASNHKLSTLKLTKWLVSIFNSTSEVDSSIFYLKKTLLNTNNNQSEKFINLGIQYAKLTQLDSAKHYINLANQLYKIHPLKEDYRFINWALGNIHYDLNNIDSALYFYKKVALDTSDMSNWYPYVLSNVGIMEIYTEREEYDSSKFYMNQFFLCPCLDYGTKAWLNEIKASFYQGINDNQNYLMHTLISSKNKDSVITELEQNINNLSQLNISHLTVIEDNFKMKNEKNEAIKQKNSAYFGLIILLIILLIFSITFYIFRNRKNNQLTRITKELSDSKFNELKTKEENLILEIKSKNTDLSQLATTLVLKREFLVGQKEKLSELLNLSSEELPRGLKMHMNDFNSYESIDSNLTLLQSNIQDVNSELYAKLKTKFPDLTENDIQICVLHLLKLNTKEISIIRNVTPKAIQVSRYRIKKKMGLGKDEDIVSYIEQKL